MDCLIASYTNYFLPTRYIIGAGQGRWHDQQVPSPVPRTGNVWKQFIGEYNPPQVDQADLIK